MRMCAFACTHVRNRRRYSSRSVCVIRFVFVVMWWWQNWDSCTVRYGLCHRTCGDVIVSLLLSHAQGEVQPPVVRALFI